MKVLCILFLTLCSIKLSGQSRTDLIEKIANDICVAIDSEESLGNLSKEKSTQIIDNCIELHSKDWKLECSKYPKSDLRGLLTHKLLVSCEKYWEIDRKLDSDSYYGNSDFFTEHGMSRYYAVKRFLVEAAATNDTKSLLKFFNKNLDENLLLERLSELLTELQAYAQTSIIDINFTPSAKVYYTRFIDYEKCFSAVKVNFQFNDKNDLLIDDWVYFPYDELRKDDAELENIEIEKIPLPPPPPGVKY